MSKNIKNLFLLKDGLVFLNHGSFGACPKVVFDVYQNWQRKLEQQPVAFLDQSRNFLPNMKQVRHALAEKLGAFPDDLVGVNNATEGLNIIARSMRLNAGDEILTSDHEYGALEKTWDAVCKRTNARIVKVEVPVPLTSAVEFCNIIKTGMSDRTKVLFLSHVTSPTSLVFPLKEVIAEARSRGIITIVDGAHAPGLIDLDLNDLNADFYSGNCHKWMMSPKGAAFLWARQDVQPMLEPLVVSHGWVAQLGGSQQKGAFGNTRFIDCFEVNGTRDPAAWLSLPEALKFVHDYDWRSMTQKSADLARQTADRIADMTQIPLLASDEFSAPQMISITLPYCDVEDVKRKLYNMFNIEIPVFRWKEKSIVRISIQPYNTQEDANALVFALKNIFKF